LGITIKLPTYDHNPGSIRFIGQADVLFKPYERFNRVDPDERLDLCRKLAEALWDPDRPERVATLSGNPRQRLFWILYS
jgi:hypothetical protein